MLQTVQNGQDSILDLNDVYNMCIRKKSYKSQAKAKKFLRSNVFSGTAYRCPICAKWHISSRGNDDQA